MTTVQVPAEFSGRLAAGKDWREIVAWVSDLPPMPHVAQKALKLVEDPACSGNDLTKVLSTDAALAARVLKIANSAMFARQREITTLNQAIMLIGLKALKGIVVAATLRQMSKGSAAIEKLIWENSMFSAMLSSKLARFMKAKWFEEIFLLSLLHTVGQIVLTSQDATAKDYGKVLEQIKTNQVDYVTAEESIYGFGHPLIGALVAKKWNFPAETCQVILHHKDPLDAPKAETEIEKQTAIVQLSDVLSHQAGIGSPEGYPSQEVLITRLMQYLQLEDKKTEIQAIVEETKTQFDSEKGIYG